MKRFLAVVLLGVSLAASADDVTSFKLTEELLGVLQVEGLVKDWRQQLDAQAIETINKALQGKTEAQLQATEKAAIARFSQRATTALDAGLNWEKLKLPVVKIYQEAFSEAEMRELLLFYKSPTGQKLLSRQPQISEATVQILRNQVQAMRPELQQIGQEFADAYSRPSAQVTRPASLPTAAPVAPTLCLDVNPRTGRACP